MRPITATLLGMLLCAGLAAAADRGYYRTPDIHGDTVVFAAEDDLWLAPVGGGPARRLTSHVGAEFFPQFSPDGRTIAFTGEYDGNRDVYTLATPGGEPKRLTWHPSSDEVVGWTPDGRFILFRSNREDPHGSTEIFRLPAAGGEPEKVPIGWAARLDIDPETGLFAFNRHQREYRTWKRYRGGTAPDVWVGDPDRADYRIVADSDANDTFPMWHGGRLFFLSDRGGTYNLWSATPDGGDLEQLTRNDAWDARWPAMGPEGRVVYTREADIWLWDPATRKERALAIDLPSDRVLTRVRYPDAARNLSELELSPDGDRLAVVARGEIFSVPVEKGITLPVTRGSGARERAVTFGPKGKKMAFLSDASGEDAIHVKDAWGRGDATVVVAAGESGWRFQPRFSPDGKWIAWADSSQTLFIAPADGGRPRKVDRARQYAITDYSWSPDGRWLAYDKVDGITDYSSVYLYDVENEAIHPVTGPTTNDGDVAWDPDGRYLYFASTRATNPYLGQQDWDNIEAKSTRLYAVLLQADLDNPLLGRAGLPPEDEEAEEEKAKDPDAGEAEAGDDDGKPDAEESDEEKADEETLEPVEIDLDGLMDRVVELPVDRGNYFGLEATKGKLFFLSAPLLGFAEMPGLFQGSGPNLTLMAYDLEKKEAGPFVEGVGGYDVSANGEKVAVLKGPGEVFVVATAAPPGPALAEGRVALSDVVVELDPRAEWRQIYYEAWRQMRDYYWDPDMAGIDWKKQRDRYAALLPRLASRADLTDLMGELYGEMSTSHTYVFGGDPGKQVPHVATGMLGARLERTDGAYRVAHIYRADPADNVRSPLLEPGVGIQEGDYLLAVNHQPFPEDRPVYAAFVNTAGKEVVLTVNDKPGADGAHEVLVRPLGSEGDLIYSDWVRRNREYVAEKTGGKIGYIHVPDMWQEGLIEFNTWFYPQLDREGMVVDTRWNGGGAVSQMLVERLRRPVDSFDRARGGGISTYPARTLNGPFVVLTNEFAGSDGDIFPRAIQLEGLAPVIGTRSWGGVVGISSLRPLVDGGLITQPQAAWWDRRGGWGLENRGVEPDIEVPSLPQEIARGVDAQLDRAIEEVMRLHATDPPVKPDFGPVPDHSRKAYRDEVGGGS
ncbi:MAG: S41 family peptidase [Acidobacteriota bacterium]|jgi:tricorn protease